MKTIESFVDILNTADEWAHTGGIWLHADIPVHYGNSEDELILIYRPVRGELKNWTSATAPYEHTKGLLVNLIRIEH